MRHAHALHVVASAQFNCCFENNWMNVHVEVAIDVRTWQACGVEFFKLSCQLLAQLSACLPGKKILQTGNRGAVGELALGVNKGGNFWRRQHRTAFNGDEMEAHAQFRVLPGKMNCLIESF